MLEDKKIGIVTVLYNSEKVLDGFFQSLNGQTYKNFVLYAVDNNSCDGTVNKIKELISLSLIETVLIEEKNNWGVAKGNNIGITKAIEDGCERIILANNDIEFSSESLERLLVARSSLNADLLVPKILFYNTNKIWYAGGKIQYLSGGSHIGIGKEDSKAFSEPKVVEYAPTCFILINKNVFEIVGLMDEKYFAYFDDTDFILRSNRHKFKMYYTPDVTIYHKVSACTSANGNDFFFHFNNRNLVYFAKKNYSHFHLAIIIVFQISLYFLRTIKHPQLPSLSKLISYYREGYYL